MKGGNTFENHIEAYQGSQNQMNAYQQPQQQQQMQSNKQLIQPPQQQPQQQHQQMQFQQPKIWNQFEYPNQQQQYQPPQQSRQTTPQQQQHRYRHQKNKHIQQQVQLPQQNQQQQQMSKTQSFEGSNDFSLQRVRSDSSALKNNSQQQLMGGFNPVVPGNNQRYLKNFKRTKQTMEQKHYSQPWSTYKSNQIHLFENNLKNLINNNQMINPMNSANCPINSSIPNNSNVSILNTLSGPLSNPQIPPISNYGFNNYKNFGKASFHSNHVNSTLSRNQQQNNFLNGASGQGHLVSQQNCLTYPTNKQQSQQNLANLPDEHNQLQFDNPTTPTINVPGSEGLALENNNFTGFKQNPSDTFSFNNKTTNLNNSFFHNVHRNYSNSKKRYHKKGFQHLDQFNQTGGHNLTLRKGRQEGGHHSYQRKPNHKMIDFSKNIQKKEHYSEMDILQQYKKFKKLKLKMNRRLTSPRITTHDLMLNQMSELQESIYKKIDDKREADKENPLLETDETGTRLPAQEFDTDYFSTQNQNNFSMLDTIIENNQKRKEKYKRNVLKLLDLNGCSNIESLKTLVQKLYKDVIYKDKVNKHLKEALRKKEELIQELKLGQKDVIQGEGHNEQDKSISDGDDLDEENNNLDDCDHNDDKIQSDNCLESDEDLEEEYEDGEHYFFQEDSLLDEECDLGEIFYDQEGYAQNMGDIEEVDQEHEESQEDYDFADDYSNQQKQFRNDNNDQTLQKIGHKKSHEIFKPLIKMIKQISMPPSQNMEEISQYKNSIDPVVDNFLKQEDNNEFLMQESNEVNPGEDNGNQEGQSEYQNQQQTQQDVFLQDGVSKSERRRSNSI